MKRINSNRKFEMSIHGIKPAVESEENVKVKKLSNNEQKMHDSTIMKAKERKRIEFQKRG